MFYACKSFGGCWRKQTWGLRSKVARWHKYITVWILYVTSSQEGIVSNLSQMQKNRVCCPTKSWMTKPTQKSFFVTWQYLVCISSADISRSDCNSLSLVVWANTRVCSAEGHVTFLLRKKRAIEYLLWPTRTLCIQHLSSRECQLISPDSEKAFATAAQRATLSSAAEIFQS